MHDILNVAVAVPQIVNWVSHALGLDVHDSFLVRVLLPLDICIKEIQNYEVEAPQIVSPGKIFLLVGIQAGIGDRTSEIGVDSLCHGHIVLHVFFGKSKIDNVKFTVVLIFANAEI